MHTVESWIQLGQYYTTYQHRLFAIDQGSGENLCILHGYPSCSYDYQHVISRLSEHYRLILHDHLGFGLSDKPLDYSYSLIEQTDHALLLWQQLGVREAHIIAHDYGTSIATELLARQERGILPIHIKSLTLGNGSMHIELSQLRLIQKLLLHKQIGPLVARLSTEQTFIRNMRNIWGDPSKANPKELKILWQFLIRGNGRAVLPGLTQYIRERRLFWHRWIGALKTTSLPVNILWATEDPVAVKEMAFVLHDEISNSQLQLIDGVGHYPMIEAPEIWTTEVLKMIANCTSSS